MGWSSQICCGDWLWKEDGCKEVLQVWWILIVKAFPPHMFCWGFFSSVVPSMPSADLLGFVLFCFDCFCCCFVLFSLCVCVCVCVCVRVCVCVCVCVCFVFVQLIHVYSSSIYVQPYQSVEEQFTTIHSYACIHSRMLCVCVCVCVRARVRTHACMPSHVGNWSAACPHTDLCTINHPLFEQNQPCFVWKREWEKTGEIQKFLCLYAQLWLWLCFTECQKCV